MITISITDFRQKVSEIINKVMFGGERVFIERNGKPACAVVSIEELRLLEAMEDKLDVEAAQEALKRDEFVDWKDAKEQLGL